MAGRPRLSESALRRHLTGVCPIPIFPFTPQGSVDLDGHAKNVRYLLDNNHLNGGLERVVATGGTSLIHHADPGELTAVVDRMGGVMGDRGVLIAGLPPNMPIAERLVTEQLRLERPPDVFMLMPLAGYYRPQGLLDTYRLFADKHGANGARFIGYMRNS